MEECFVYIHLNVVFVISFLKKSVHERKKIFNLYFRKDMNKTKDWIFLCHLNVVFVAIFSKKGFHERKKIFNCFIQSSCLDTDFDSFQPKTEYRVMCFQNV